MEHTQETRLALPNLSTLLPAPLSPRTLTLRGPKPTQERGSASCTNPSRPPPHPTPATTRPKRAKEELSWMESQPTEPALLIHSPTHPPPPPLRLGGPRQLPLLGRFPPSGNRAWEGPPFPSPGQLRLAHPPGALRRPALAIVFSPEQRPPPQEPGLRKGGPKPTKRSAYMHHPLHPLPSLTSQGTLSRPSPQVS